MTVLLVCLLFVLTACVTQTPNNVASSGQTALAPPLEPVNIRLLRRYGYYAVPGCTGYQHPPTDRKSFMIPTAQEAELAGFRPSKECESLAAQRIATETTIFGKMGPTPISELWRAQLHSARQQTDLESQQTDLEERQVETKGEQESFAEKQGELEERQDDVEKTLKP